MKLPPQQTLLRSVPRMAPAIAVRGAEGAGCLASALPKNLRVLRLQLSENGLGRNPRGLGQGPQPCSCRLFLSRSVQRQLVRCPKWFSTATFYVGITADMYTKLASTYSRQIRVFQEGQCSKHSFLLAFKTESITFRGDVGQTFSIGHELHGDLKTFLIRKGSRVARPLFEPEMQWSNFSTEGDMVQTACA